MGDRRSVSVTSIEGHKLQAFAPHDVLWSSPKYVLVASGGLLGGARCLLFGPSSKPTKMPRWTLHGRELRDQALTGHSRHILLGRNDSAETSLTAEPPELLAFDLPSSHGFEVAESFYP